MPSPITKVVIIYLENHTFDNVASEVPGTDGDRSLALAPDVVRRLGALNRRDRRRSARELNPSAEVQVMLDAAQPVIEFGELAEQFVFHPAQIGILPI